MINRARKIELINASRQVLSGLPEVMNQENSPIKGNKALAQVVINRIETFTSNADEMKYCVESVMVMIADIGVDPHSNKPLITNKQAIDIYLAKNPIKL